MIRSSGEADAALVRFASEKKMIEGIVD